MVTGMIGTVVHLKKKQARINNQNGMLVVNYRGVEKTALTSFLVTLSHFLLYVPTMLVIGLRFVLFRLHSWWLSRINPGSKFLCIHN